MRRLKINKDNLKRLGMTPTDAKYGNLTNKFLNNCQEHVQAILNTKLPYTQKLTMIALLALTENDTKPFVENKEGLDELTVVVNQIARTLKLRKELNSHGKQVK